MYDTRKEIYIKKFLLKTRESYKADITGYVFDFETLPIQIP